MITDHPARASTSCPTSYDAKPGYVNAHGLSPSLIALWRQSQLLVPHGLQQEVHAMSGEEGYDTFPVLMARPAAGGPYHLPQLNEYRAASSKYTNASHSFSPNNNIMCSQVLRKANDGRMLINDANSQYPDNQQYDVKPGPNMHTHIQNIIKSGSPFFEEELMDDAYPGPPPESFRELLLQECSRGHNSGYVPLTNSENPSQNVGSLVTAEMQEYYHALEGIGNHSCDGALNQALQNDAKRFKDGYEKTNINLLQLASRAAAVVSKNNSSCQQAYSCAAASDKYINGYDYPGGSANQGMHEDAEHNAVAQHGEVSGTIGSHIVNIVGRNQPIQDGAVDEDKTKNTEMAELEHHFNIVAARAPEKSRFGAGSSSNVICFGQGGAAAEEVDVEVLNIGEALQDAFVLVELQHHDEPASAAGQLQYSLRRRSGSAGASSSLTLQQQRRERINSRLKTLQELVPNGSKVDLVTMLEKAINYVKFLQLQLKVLTDDEFWSNAQQFLGQEGSILLDKGLGNASLQSSNVLSK
ncbi:hypothetical protein GOP47_0000111 [Adiantum capillus-veneris]|uniref:BHLH domain-containing protein n=1 Tax=Adiantum capillus-veneris TaxID=13818 RepID=A0A9D4VCY4_ADICA|nr:hypothetical protein GOP47_0000111 [Adiantum capillus-veneris]